MEKRTTRAKRTTAVCTWLLVCLGRQGVAASASDNFGSGKLLAAIGGHSNPEGHEHAHEHALHEARISHVRTTLNNRLHAVLAGSRTRQFEKWASKQGDLQVISMHGVDESKLDFDKDGDNGDGRVASSDGLFPDDAINLSIIGGVGVPELNQGNHVELPGEHGVSMLDLFLRSIRLSFHFTPVVSTSWLAFLSSTFRTKVWFKWVATCLASSGPAFIKWGQWASTRSDMFPESLCVALSQLHNDAPSHSWKHTEKVMEASLGLPKGSLLRVFDSFDKTPLASGSIAQVHLVSLNGTSVVAKVRHPRVAKLIDMDFRLMRITAMIVDWLPALSWLHIGDSVEQFSHTMAAQAHLNVEGHHLEVLNYNFRNWNHVTFPRPLYASSAVILETFESGQIVTDILDDYDALAAEVALEDGTFSVEEADGSGAIEDTGCLEGYQMLPMNVARFIVTTGLSVYLKMLLVDKQMHADLHPGNIMLDLANRHLGITLVDAGMVAQLSPEESTNFIGLLCSIGDGDGVVAARCALRFSSESLLTKEEEKSFVHDMDELFQERCGGYHANTDVGHVLRGVLGMIRKHKVRIDANYATLVVNCLCIESLGRRVCPDYNVLDGAKSLLQAYQGLCYDKRDGSLNTNPSAVRYLGIKVAEFHAPLTPINSLTAAERVISLEHAYCISEEESFR